MRQLISPDEALRLVVDAAPLSPTIEMPIEAALGFTLAQSVHADRAYPPFRRAMMDGFAVRAADAGNTLRITGEIAAGAASTLTVQPGEAIEIMTGAACPDGADAVAQKEIVQRENDWVILPQGITAGQNIAGIGNECDADYEALSPGDTITPLALGVLASFGCTRARVYARPRVAIISTGNELVPPGVEPGAAQIRNSNGPMLTAMARAISLTDVTCTHAPDDMAALRAALESASTASVVILSGAVSAGKYDQVPDVLRAFGAEPVFHKVMQRPGKPLFFAAKSNQLFFGLPGNPLSCHLGFHRYVSAAIRRMTGQTPSEPNEGTLTAAVKSNPTLTIFQLARVEYATGIWGVTPIRGKGSADIYTSGRANALLRIPPQSGNLTTGSAVSFEWLAGCR